MSRLNLAHPQHALKFPHTLLFGILLFLIFSIDAFAVTKRTATLYLANQTNKRIVYAEVVHKYSNVYNQVYYWTPYNGRFQKGLSPKKKRKAVMIRTGQDQPCRYAVGCSKVTYHTGALTTGKDWWYVSWAFENDNKVYYSDPTNFRGAIDVTARIAKEAIAAGIAIGGYGTCPVTLGLSCLGAYGATQLTYEIFGSGSTKGMKQHFLTAKDAGKEVKITMYPHGRLKISSPSGVSETRYSSQKATMTKH